MSKVTARKGQPWASNSHNQGPEPTLYPGPLKPQNLLVDLEILGATIFRSKLILDQMRINTVIPASWEVAFPFASFRKLITLFFLSHNP